MSLFEFFNGGGNVQPQQASNDFTSNPNINNFCKRFFEKAGSGYQHSLPNFIKLAFKNIGLITEMLKSPEIKEIETVANNAVNNGLVSKDTVSGLTKAISLFK